MDAAGAFTADDNLDSVGRRETGSSNVGEHSVPAAKGGIGSKLANVTETEDTPLLVESRSSSRTLGDYGDGGNEWERVPWYKRPSVSLRCLLILRTFRTEWHA